MVIVFFLPKSSAIPASLEVFLEGVRLFSSLYPLELVFSTSSQQLAERESGLLSVADAESPHESPCFFQRRVIRPFCP